jgi:UDP-MurNAc hydroxylase
MYLQTIGHASILIRDMYHCPILLTDPWLVGSTYWRSWWIQNYPNKILRDELQKVPTVYITHEHPDHFHMPSIRTLGKTPQYFFPDLPETGFISYLGSRGFHASVIKPREWKFIHPKVAILSLPVLNNDSILLIETPTSFIANFSDVKASVRLMKTVSKAAKKSGKKFIFLSSYSAASIVNSFRRSGETVSMFSKKDFVKYIKKSCDIMNPDFFIPFASQAIFIRSDSKWANAYKVTFDDIKNGWDSKTTLLHPYTTLDLNNFHSEFVPVDEYNGPGERASILAKTQERIDQNQSLSEIDEHKLEEKMNKFSIFFRLMFPSGIGFQLGNQSYTISWKSRCSLTKGLSPDIKFVIDLPPGAIKDAINNGHFGDLQITMFTIIHMSDRSADPRLIFIFFVLLSFDDYGHFRGFSSFFRWAKSMFIQFVSLRLFPIKSSGFD